MIHYLRQEEKSRSRKLWEEIFVEDSQSFVDFYYAEKARRNKILVAEEDNEIVAMLHRNRLMWWLRTVFGGSTISPGWLPRRHGVTRGI